MSHKNGEIGMTLNYWVGTQNQSARNFLHSIYISFCRLLIGI